MSFINSTAAAEFSQDYDNFFTYFSRSFIVHKDPVRIVEQVQSAPLYGYGQSSEEFIIIIPTTQMLLIVS